MAGRPLRPATDRRLGEPLRPVIPINACTLRITAAAGTKLAGAYSSGTVIPQRIKLKDFFPDKSALQPEGLLFPVTIFATAASRRSLDRISVPV